MSQSELAAGLANPSYVSMLESGKRTPSLDIIVKLAAKLGVAPSALTDSSSIQTIESEREGRDNQYLALNIRAQGYLDLGDMETARELYCEIYRMAEEEGNRKWMLSVGMSLDGILQSLGDNQARYQLLSNLDAISGDHLPDLRFRVKTSLADAAWDTGMLRYAETQVRLALDLLAEARLQNTTEHARLLGMLVVLRCDLGEWEGNDDYVQLMLAAAAVNGHEQTVGWAHWSAAVAYSLMERPDQALYHLAEAEALTNRFITQGEWAWFCRSAAGILLAAGVELDRVRAYLTQAEEVLRHNSLPAQRSRLKTVWARYELAAGRAPEAERLCTELLETAWPPLSTVDRARMQMLRAHALVAMSRTEDALIQLRVAAGTFENMGAFRWAARAWRELDALRSRRR